MKLAGKKIGILIESDYYEPEIWYYKNRFAEEGAEVVFLSKLWGQQSLEFKGHEFRAPFRCDRTFEDMDDAELATYAAIIVPAGMVSDRLRWTPDVKVLPDAVKFLARAFANEAIVKGIICHGLWLVASAPELVRGRRLTTHNNLHGDALNMGAVYVDADVVVDGDLVTGRTGGHCHLFARRIIEQIAAASPEPAFAHTGLTCRDLAVTERFYTKHFGFKRARVVDLGGGKQIVFLRNATTYLELFQGEGKDPAGVPPADGFGFPGYRHIAFQVPDVEAFAARVGSELTVNLGPLHFDSFLQGWGAVWVRDPDDRVVEICQGYRDEDSPPPFPG